MDLIKGVFSSLLDEGFGSFMIYVTANADVLLIVFKSILKSRKQLRQDILISLSYC